MSVILYDAERFERIGASLSCKCASTDGRRVLFPLMEGGYCRKNYKRLEDRRECDVIISGFINRLHRSNVECFNGQYACNENSRFHGDDTEEVSPIDIKGLPYPTRHAFVKALCGIRYNLIENSGAEHSESGCYEQVCELINNLCYEIVCADPAYERGEW